MSRAYDISTLVLSVMCCGAIVSSVLLTPACVSAQFAIHVVLFAHCVYAYHTPVISFNAAQLHHNHGYRRTCEVSVHSYPRLYHSFKNMVAHEIILGIVLVLCWTMPSAPVTSFEAATLSLLTCMLCRTRILQVLLIGNFLVLVRFMQYPSLGSFVRMLSFAFGVFFTRLLPHRAILHVVCAGLCLFQSRVPIESVFALFPSLVVYSVLRDLSHSSDCLLLTSVCIWLSLFLLS